MGSGSDPVRRLSSHPIDFAAATASSPPGSPEFVSPRGDGSVYGSPQEDFMSARSGSLTAMGSQNLDGALSAAAANAAADAEKPEAAFLPLDAQHSHKIAPKPEAPGVTAERADSLRRTFGSLPADPSTNKSKLAAKSADLEANTPYASSSAFAGAAGAGGMKDPDYQFPEEVAKPSGQRWGWTIITLLSVQLGWGLWLMPYTFSRLGWGGAAITVGVVACAALYSSRMITQLKLAVPEAVLFGDIGHAAYGTVGRVCTYLVVYSLDATRCIVIQLAATQSLQHLVRDAGLSLWAYGGVVAGAAFFMVQVQSLPNLTGFLTIGTTACLTALGITIAKLAQHPVAGAQHEVFRITAAGHGGLSLEAMIVAVMSVFFAFGGQFAFVEIITSMRRPVHFPRASFISLLVLVSAYFALGSVGYWSQGRDMTSDIIVWSLSQDSAARAAAAALLLQALSQYLVNINVWAHNILTLCARAFCSKEASRGITTAGDHGRLAWLVTTAAVVGYSLAVCVAVPFFFELVGLITAVTYLTVAHTLPAVFCLRLLHRKQHWLDSTLQALLVPASLAVSGLGTYASVQQLVLKLQQKY